MKKLFKGIFILIMLLEVCACNAKSTVSENSQNADSTFIEKRNAATSTSVTDSNKIDSIINEKIASLPEFKELLKYNDRDGDVSISVVKRPDSDFNYYWVQVGRDHPDRFEPIYNFYVTPDRFEILYYDTENDTTITLKQWREKRK